MINQFFNEDCFQTMSRMPDSSIDMVLTSPPYNHTKRKGGYADKENRYDVYQDWMSEEEYLEWSVKLFTEYDRVLNENKIVLYNFSYSIENPSLPYKLVAKIIQDTDWVVADTIVWKKSNAIPHPASYNRLNRIMEFVFVFCRKSEIKSFDANKKVTKVGKNGQKYYEVVDNFIQAKNNDASTKLNKATYSTDFCEKLLNIYAKPDFIVYDSFMGTGTTANACKNLDLKYIGSELSQEQVDYSKNRLTGKDGNG